MTTDNIPNISVVEIIPEMLTIKETSERSGLITC